MKVFLSWSGKRSEEAARAFWQWLPDVLQSVEPWMSSEDVGSGAGWNQEIRAALDQSNFGIIFVTRDNRQSEWLMFEAGAIAKHVADARVVPLIVDEDLSPEMLTGPLGQLQARTATEEKIRRLIGDINFSCSSRLESNRLARCFDSHWPTLKQRLDNLPEPMGETPVLDEKTMLAEILHLIRAERTHQSKGGNNYLSGVLDQAMKRAIHGQPKGLQRLKLRLSEFEWENAEKERILALWETFEENELKTEFQIDGRTYGLHRNGDIELPEIS
ncbi:toll/interleukin-1 receptor domain-containing protein [Stieleria sp. ICT_E10.1]|uniref:toll/interleukin-1 receptor domain-containing protein n=1 Tax=Stieleria sedimenti TaxID=2976331 RepID=UPI00218098C7|nr:toll/interleukin-1 receptor domain-containing protein [Stieleria sedimenti]MCS7466135.1 toll/interleukin-1 receptor domain-containing protein [Stieleria sedimenti]